MMWQLALSIAAIVAGDTQDVHRPIVILAVADRLDYVAIEQDLHPGTTEVYVGVLYDLHLRNARLLTKGDGNRPPSDGSVRIIMTHPVPRGTRLLLVVDREHERPVTLWWDRAGRRTCIPPKTVAYYKLEATIVRYRKLRDGSVCPLM